MGLDITAVGYKQEYGFRAGSYSSYNTWRDELARMAGYAPVKGRSEYGHDYAAGAWAADGGPFNELIDFSDCEGTLSAETCCKLAKDFEEWEDKARDFGASDPWFFELYQKWAEACRIASHGGYIDFH